MMRIRLFVVSLLACTSVVVRVGVTEGEGGVELGHVTAATHSTNWRVVIPAADSTPAEDWPPRFQPVARAVLPDSSPPHHAAQRFGPVAPLPANPTLCAATPSEFSPAAVSPELFHR